jgi:hypothetical protein
MRPSPIKEPTMGMVEIPTFADLLKLFDPSVHDRLEDTLRPDDEGYVVFEVLDFCSSQFGRRTSCVVGPSRELFKSIDECEGTWLGDLPSQRQYADA